MARRGRRAVGPAEISLYRVNSFFRLLRYATPYKGRLAWAVLAMVLYAIASALVIDPHPAHHRQLLPNRARTAFHLAGAGRAVFRQGRRRVFLRLPDGRRWPARRDGSARPALRSHPRTIGEFLCAQHHAASSCRACPTTSGRCSARCRRPRVTCSGNRSRSSVMRESCSGLTPRLATVCLTGAPIIVYPLVRLGQRIRRTARRSQEAQEVMSHVGAETFSAHRIVKAFGAEEREAGPVPRRADTPVPDEHARRSRAVADAAVHGAARGRRHGGRALARQRADCGRPALDGRVHVLSGGAADDVRARQKS